MLKSYNVSWNMLNTFCKMNAPLIGPKSRIQNHSAIREITDYASVRGRDVDTGMVRLFFSL